jgi:hypothetical protein
LASNQQLTTSNGSCFTPAAFADKIEVEADVAQLVEQSIRNRQVIGSSPIVGSILPRCYLHEPPITNHHSFSALRASVVKKTKTKKPPGKRWLFLSRENSSNGGKTAKTF